MISTTMSRTRDIRSAQPKVLRAVEVILVSPRARSACRACERHGEKVFMPRSRPCFGPSAILWVSHLPARHFKMHLDRKVTYIPVIWQTGMGLLLGLVSHSPAD
jgi:hypothetical protein